MTSKKQAALELRKALQYFLETLDLETQSDKILEVPSLFPAYQVGKIYKTKDIFKYGENTVGDPQLYQVLQDHTSAEHWDPATSTSMYKKIGITAEGYPEWIQPLGASDAYSIGDIVSYNGYYYTSTVDANTWEPGVYGWELTVI